MLAILFQIVYNGRRPRGKEVVLMKMFYAINYYTGVIVETPNPAHITLTLVEWASECETTYNDPLFVCGYRESWGG